MIILDTNVLSELIRPKPSEPLQDWVAKQVVSTLFTTTITHAEMLLGAVPLPSGKRRSSLSIAIADMFDLDFSGRLLPFDSRAAREFAAVVAGRRQIGRPIAQLDAQIASIAKSQGASLATRNTHDFQGCGLHLIDPWEPL